MSGRRGRLTAALAILFVLAVGASAPEARAGTYEMRACLPSRPLTFEARREIYLNGRVEIVQNCDRQAYGWLGIYQTRKGTSFAAGEGAGYRWQAPQGTYFIAARALAKLKNANGIAAQFYATNPDGGYLSFDGGHTHDGVERQLYVDFSGQPRTQVAARLACLTSPPCSNRASDVKAFFELRDIALRLRDEGSPNVFASGDLFDRPTPIYGGWVSFSFTASDGGSGIARAWAEINGTRIELAEYFCPGNQGDFSDRTRPCPESETRYASLDTRLPPFAEGLNRILICAEDYAANGAGNTTCSPLRSITVDNLAPETPRDLTVVGGEGWRASNGFDLAWNNPDGATPVTSARWWLVDTETSVLASGPHEATAAGIDRLNGIEVPGPGRFVAYVQLRDAAGNLGQAASATLRFDDRPPEDFELESPAAWLGAADFPLRLAIGPPRRLGPSGVSSYLVKLTQEESPALCPAPDCAYRALEARPQGPAQDSTIELDRLPPGRYELRAAAVSGAGLRSSEDLRAPLLVDLTDPTTDLLGLPEGWAREPVTLTVRARDEESGMAVRVPLDRPPPMTAIESEGWVREKVGDEVTLSLDREGVHRVRYWARDLAGNTNDGRRDANGHRHDPAGEATVRIDWTPPRVEFLPFDPTLPELIRARVKDGVSRPAGGWIVFRRAGETGEPPTALDTTFAGDVLSARFPSDALGDGEYEVWVQAIDRAGNTGGGSQAPGATTRLRVPLKPQASLSLAYAGEGSGNRRILRHGATRPVRGLLRDGAGRPVSDAPIEIHESFGPGSRAPLKITEVRTDDRGVFTYRPGPGPSRRIFARFPGGPRLARAISETLGLAVKGAVRLDLRPSIAVNGEPVRMRGRIEGRGARLPAKGKLLAIQYLDADRRSWRPVELIRTDARGRFRFSYRFRTVASPQRFVFRAVAVPEAGWPYLEARSAARAIVVYPR